MKIQLWLLIVVNLFAKNEKKMKTIFASSMASTQLDVNFQ